VTFSNEVKAMRVAERVALLLSAASRLKETRYGSLADFGVEGSVHTYGDACGHASEAMQGRER